MKFKIRSPFIWTLALLLLVAGCSRRQAMYKQPRYEPYGESDFFADQRTVRPLPPGTISHGQLHDDELLYKGTEGGKLATRFPMKITSEVMARGASRYQINCLPCHGHAGDGQGIVPLRGFPKMPSSFHEERLRVAPVGHFFNVITNGLGIMSGYAAQITPEDRYAIIAYVRALQLSQNVPASQLTAADKEKLAEETP